MGQLRRWHQQEDRKAWSPCGKEERQQLDWDSSEESVVEYKGLPKLKAWSRPERESDINVIDSTLTDSTVPLLTLAILILTHSIFFLGK